MTVANVLLPVATHCMHPQPDLPTHPLHPTQPTHLLQGQPKPQAPSLAPVQRGIQQRHSCRNTAAAGRVHQQLRVDGRVQP
jgi:hypothetical protein